ncbi:unnamed protein product [Echinostoma caproni]|uniref:E3 ubiquitin-protein ligase n=1 Tax=Echinostoma caproni TaxID=27848 RepID=A0A183BEH5_9TREM|nr:unnamed protein product [Echinostoma caproni]
MRNEATSPMQYEALMRLTQLALPYTALDPHWNALSNWLLSSGMTFVQSHLPVVDESDDARLLAMLITRTLCLLTRCAVHSLPAGGNQTLESQCTASLAELIPYLRAGSEEGVPIKPRKLNLCVRLAAAHCVAWCINQPVFPSESLTTHLGSLFHAIVRLIYYDRRWVSGVAPREILPYDQASRIASAEEAPFTALSWGGVVFARK